MTIVRYTDAMWAYLRQRIDEVLLVSLFEYVNVIPSENENTMSIDNDFFSNASETVSLIDKVNLTMCFLHNGGSIIFNETEYIQANAPIYVSNLFNFGIITNSQETDILLPWIDITNSREPYFTHQE